MGDNPQLETRGERGRGMDSGPRHPHSTRLPIAHHWSPFFIVVAFRGGILLISSRFFDLGRPSQS